MVSRGGTSAEDIAERNRKSKIKELEYDTYVLQEINKKYNIIANNIQETFTRMEAEARSIVDSLNSLNFPPAKIRDTFKKYMGDIAYLEKQGII